MIDYELARIRFEKVVERLSNELKYITISKYVNPTGVAGFFSDALRQLEEDELARKELNQMLDIMQRRFPKVYEKMMDEFRSEEH